MMKVKFNKKAEAFEVYNRTQECTPASNDGMIRAFEYEVRTTTSYSFENERTEGDCYVYDMAVVVSADDGMAFTPKERTMDEESFRQAFDSIYHDLRKRGLEMLDHPAYVIAEAKRSSSVWTPTFATAADEEAVCLTLFRQVYLAEEGDEVVGLDQLRALVRETDENAKERKIARAVGDYDLLNRKYKVAAGALSDELFDSSEYVPLKKAGLTELLESEKVSEADICMFLQDFAKRVGRKTAWHMLKMPELGRFVPLLPDECLPAVVGHCLQTADNLELFRRYCPEKIRWKEVSLEDMRSSDLDLMIAHGKAAESSVQWDFLARCMEEPGLERKIVDQAYVLGRRDFRWLLQNLRTTTAIEVLRIVLTDLLKDDEKISYTQVEGLFDMPEYVGATRRDYEIVLEVARRLRRCDCDDRERVAAGMLRIGLESKVHESELAVMLEELKIDGKSITLYSPGLNRVYEELSFAPGLAWIKAEQERNEARKRQIAEQRKLNNEKVVQFVQRSGKVAVCVKMSSLYDGTNRLETRSKDGCLLGHLDLADPRVMRIEGRYNDYLVDIQRAKNPKNGILHIDVLDRDAGWIIGKGGENLRAAAEKLRGYGCRVSTIRVHKHDEL